MFARLFLHHDAILEKMLVGLILCPKEVNRCMFGEGVDDEQHVHFSEMCRYTDWSEQIRVDACKWFLLKRRRAIKRDTSEFSSKTIFAVNNFHGRVYISRLG